MKAATSSVGALGVDTIATITSAQAHSLESSGFSFVVRYLGGLTAVELSEILGEGLAVMPVTYSRGGGWIPSGALGQTDGTTTVSQLYALKFPVGVTVWCDLEGMAGTVADTIAYAEAWGALVQAAGYIPGVYVGAGVPLTSAELYALENIHAYWHSCSEVPEVATCGYQMIQLTPPNIIFHKSVTVDPLEVDIDVIQQDRLGRLPSWATN